MEDFEVNGLVDQLLFNLGSDLSPEEGLDVLERGNSKSVKVKEDVYKELALKSQDSAEFIKKYELLSSKKIDVLEPYVQFLDYLLVKDKVVLVFNKRMESMSLEYQFNNSPGLDHPSTSNQASPDDRKLFEVKSRLNVCMQDIESKKAKDAISAEHKKATPEFTRWKDVRPFMSLDFAYENVENYLLPLGGVPFSSQAHELIEDLWIVLRGYQGKFICAEPLNSPFADRTFRVSPEIDSTLRDFINMLLPIASHYSYIQRFIEEKTHFKWGRINQALAYGFGKYIRLYLSGLLEIQCEYRRNNGLDIYRISAMLQPTSHIMAMLADIAKILTNAESVGGRTLSLLHAEVKNSKGNENHLNVCLDLTQTACVPFFESLDYWIHKGHVYDPLCDEFMIVDNVSIEKSENDGVDGKYSEDYWVQRYIIKNENNVPSFVEPIKDKILRTGKYLNVIRHCKKSEKTKLLDSQKQRCSEMKFTEHDCNFITMINEAYDFASQSLLELLMEDYDLVHRIRSVKHYFLLEQGDFIVQLLDLCESELMKPIDEVVPSKLESLLELALSSGGKADLYKENIRMALLPHQLNFQIFTILSISTVAENDYKKLDLNKSLTGLEAFSLGLTVEWPLSLIFNQKIIGCYQMLFRHLLLCKHVERQLCKVWIIQKAAKTTLAKNLRPIQAKAFNLRQQMLFCIQNLEYYMMEEVIEPNYTQFIKTLHEVKNIDDVMEKHWTYLSQCMKECMLTSPILMRTVKQIITCCVEFCDFIQVEQTSCPSSTLEEVNDTESVVSNTENYEAKINQFSDEFSSTIVCLLEAITQTDQGDKGDRLYNILYRENFSGFYSKALDSRLMKKVIRKNTYKKEKPSLQQATRPN